ncbi:hypothetical protein TWF569_011966 [Orbilia oligospora]|uniref:Uncharacterized protein n=1 Tax=Orbilia oligospora TaxID=2813651 RepID=A0A7C8JC06_ORBOL|nr:hypothetical protein TWF103_012011 [Orbilia oligospora]KAF3109797.1 hypothetical protein TWF102_012027 [Orbilia oligospora]KAF3116875.1 hypothetical protein TWF706_011980 [Orbilia oligospora]KAF3142205.1 hypothetical protein TWF594_011871 [Orbilia oligospora]KAF3148122.1 hypothetical protein TWF569_011966 [Orbilia oligospora]
MLRRKERSNEHLLAPAVSQNNQKLSNPGKTLQRYGNHKNEEIEREKILSTQNAFIERHPGVSERRGATASHGFTLLAPQKNNFPRKKGTREVGTLLQGRMLNMQAGKTFHSIDVQAASFQVCKCTVHHL